jgi:hypothetical protein
LKIKSNKFTIVKSDRWTAHNKKIETYNSI